MSDDSADDQSTVYPVWHYCAKFEEPLDYSEDKEDGQRPRCIGVFSTQERADAAVQHCRSQPGFRDWPDSFKIYHGRLDDGGWETGFFNWAEDDDE